MNIEVGQKVYLKPVNNAARYGNNEIQENTVMKVGRKYFFVGREGAEDERFWTKFEIESLSQVTNYANDWELYFSKQEILDEEESKKIIGEVRSKFDWIGKVDLTLDQLRRIKEIISEVRTKL